jgi:hypothetical protein
MPMSTSHGRRLYLLRNQRHDFSWHIDRRFDMTRVRETWLRNLL